jgi:hypothetical protein
MTCCLSCHTELTPLDAYYGSGIGLCDDATCETTKTLKKFNKEFPRYRCWGCGGLVTNIGSAKNVSIITDGMSHRYTKCLCEHCGNEAIFNYPLAVITPRTKEISLPGIISP